MAKAVQAEKTSLQLGDAHQQQQRVMKDIPTAAAGVPSLVQGVGLQFGQPKADGRAQLQLRHCMHKGDIWGLNTRH